MHFSKEVHQSSPSKLLPFRVPVLRKLNGSVDLDLLPHDVDALIRPVEAQRGADRRPASPGEQQRRAHDARNLLSSLDLLSDLIGEPGVLTEGDKHFASDLKAITGSLSKLVEGIASGSRPEGLPSAGLAAHAGRPGTSADPAFSLEPLLPRLKAAPEHSSRQVQQQARLQDAGVMVKNCERLLQAIAGPSVDLNISYEAGLGELSMGGEALTRVLINLVSNASEAMPRGGRVTITVRKALGSRPAALVRVQDTGEGIPAHAMGLLFQPGFSSRKASKRWPSTVHHGLGLTIVREIVEAAGGSVRVASALGKGTTFEMKVPCRWA